MKNNVDSQYFRLIKHILENGVLKSDRTETGTLSVFDWTMRFDMSDGFPLLTSKKMFIKGIIHELIWFLRGDTNIKYLVDNAVNIWTGDAYKRYKNSFDANSVPLSKEEFSDKIKNDDDFSNQWGDLGPVYGRQWRKVKTDKSTSFYNKWGYEDEKLVYIDQISDLVWQLKNTPDSRRLMVSAWNVGELSDMLLPPCHFGFQCYTSELTLEQRIKWWCDSLGKHISYGDDLNLEKLDELGVPKRKLDLKWFQRSVDTFLGLPFNISSYGLLLHLLAKEVNMIAGDLIFNGGDCHIYLNHIEQCKTQMKQKTFQLPKLELRGASIFELTYEDIKISNYQSSDSIKAELSN